MRCPNCDEHIELEDYDSTEPFEGECCGALLRLEVDESTYKGARDEHLVLVDPEYIV